MVWHRERPRDVGGEVTSFAVEANGDVLLIDSLLPPEPGAVLNLVDDRVGDRVAILISIPYHVSSAEGSGAGTAIAPTARSEATPLAPSASRIAPGSGRSSSECRCRPACRRTPSAARAATTRTNGRASSAARWRGGPARTGQRLRGAFAPTSFV
jgi:hypothetical protein